MTERALTDLIDLLLDPDADSDPDPEKTAYDSLALVIFPAVSRLEAAPTIENGRGDHRSRFPS